MNKEKISLAEERRLLQMQCELARLKLIMTHKKTQRQQNTSHEWQSLAVSALSALGNQQSAWRIAMMPKQNRYRALLMAGLVLSQFLKRK